MSDRITVLRCAGSLVLTKIHTPDGTRAYDRPKWFTESSYDIADLQGLYKLLGGLRTQRNACVLRGRFVGEQVASTMTDADGDPVFRSSSRQTRRLAGLFRDEPARWLSLDIDGWDGASVDPAQDPETAIEEWIAAHLPAAFHDVSAVWQLSASAGVKPGLRAHLWYWLAEPANGAQLKAWAKANGGVDPSFFENVRIHYTADPLFQGVDDPVARRLGMIEGLFSDEVALDLGAAPMVDDENEIDPDAELDSVVAGLENLRPPLGLSLDQARDLVMALPRDEVSSYAGWLEVGMALHHEFNGSDEGKSLFDEFSAERTPEDYDSHEIDEKWASFGRSTGAPKTMRSIQERVRREGYDFLRCMKAVNDAPTYRAALDAAARYDLSETEVDTVLPRLIELAKEGGRVAKAAAVKKELREQRKTTAEDAGDGRGEYLEKWITDAFLIRYRRGGVRLLSVKGEIWVYDKGVWRTQEKLALKGEVIDFLEALRVTNRDEHAALFRSLKESGRDTTLNALSNAIVEMVLAVCADPSDPDPLNLTRAWAPSVMNCANAELWFDTDGEMSVRPHDPDNRFIHQLKVEYDSEATCPLFLESLRTIFRNNIEPDETIRHLFELFGYWLQLSRDYAAWGLFHGGGSNGKSYVTRILQELMGSGAWVAGSLSSFDEERNSHSTAALVSKMLLVDDDYNKGKLLLDGLIKKLSEAKLMSANPKYGAMYNFACRASPLILSNSWPRTRDMSYGLTRRAHVFDFNTTISEEEADHGLAAKIIRDELPGVLNECIRGWQRVLRRGGFKKPPACLVAEGMWLQNRHALGAFLRDCVEVTGDNADRVPCVEVYQAFNQWKQLEGVDLRYGRNTFYEEIAQTNGVDRVTVHNARYFSGIKLKEVDPLEGFDFDL